MDVHTRSIVDEPYSADEVHKALFSMAPWKAPGPDGFHAGFYQSNWNTVGAASISICLQILNGANSMGDINSNYIVLIPKKKNPRYVIEFWPISLCNVVAKVVAKTMAN